MHFPVWSQWITGAASWRKKLVALFFFGVCLKYSRKDDASLLLPISPLLVCRWRLLWRGPIVLQRILFFPAADREKDREKDRGVVRQEEETRGSLFNVQWKTSEERSGAKFLLLLLSSSSFLPLLLSLPASLDWPASSSGPFYQFEENLLEWIECRRCRREELGWNLATGLVSLEVLLPRQFESFLGHRRRDWKLKIKREKNARAIHQVFRAFCSTENRLGSDLETVSLSATRPLLRLCVI